MNLRIPFIVLLLPACTVNVLAVPDDAAPDHAPVDVSVDAASDSSVDALGDASLPDGSPNDATLDVAIDASPDVSSSDATVDAKVDATSKDASSDAAADADASVCAPASLVNFVPTFKPPLRVPSACTQTEIDNFYSWCVDPGNLPACKALRVANPTCASCLATPDVAAKHGPLVGDNSLMWNNVSGCVGLVDTNVSPTGCAAKMSALEQCTRAACEPSCPVFDGPSLNAFVSCTAAAETGVCAAYSQPAKCANPIAKGICITPPTIAAKYASMAPRFCGP